MRTPCRRRSIRRLRVRRRRPPRAALGQSTASLSPCRFAARALRPDKTSYVEPFARGALPGVLRRPLRTLRLRAAARRPPTAGWRPRVRAAPGDPGERRPGPEAPRRRRREGAETEAAHLVPVRPREQRRAASDCGADRVQSPEEELRPAESSSS